MILYHTSGTCSVAVRIALEEANLDYKIVNVDLRNKRTETGDDYRKISGKGYVPVLVFDNDLQLTETSSILFKLAEDYPPLHPSGEQGKWESLDMLGFISTELHKRSAVMFFAANEEAMSQAREKLMEKQRWISDQITGDYLFGDHFTVADVYLYVTLRWSKAKEIKLPEPLDAFYQRVDQRAAVQKVIQADATNAG